jgi:hypothetical protein
MKKISFLLLAIMVFFFSCDLLNDNNVDGWSEEDQAYYNDVIALQDNASENFDTWLLTMDSLEAINQLQQFFLSDASVTSATIGSQGIAVQYSNGMRGGIFIDPEDGPLEDTLTMEPFSKISSSVLDEKSIPNIKKAILLNPSYWERSGNTNDVIAKYNLFLPRVGFGLQNIYKGMDASVDRFTQLTGYGLIHIYSHGWAWPKKQAIAEVYLMTGEKVNEGTSKKYWDEIKNGNILITKTKTYWDTKNEVYFLSEKFVASHNDFSKDTVLFYGGFCYSFLGTWPEIENTFAKGAYFGYTWRVETGWNCIMAKNLIDSLTDTLKTHPVNTERWIVNPNPSKQRWDNGDQKFCMVQYRGDATLTLWKDTTAIVTSPVTNITQTTATCGGNIKSDGGSPVTARGVCWNFTGNPTISDSHTTDGSGTGEFVSSLTGLSPDTLYYVRAYATNAGGTMYGNQVYFTTSSAGFYIGQSYGGGIIFYIDGTGQHGLIAASSDINPGIGAPWGDLAYIGGTAAEIGTGQANTNIIVNGCSTAGIAARICDDLVLNEYDDWFLPSRSELDELCKSNIGGFDIVPYWSSTEGSIVYFQDQACCESFNQCLVGLNTKTTVYLVRAIRAF